MTAAIIAPGKTKAVAAVWSTLSALWFSAVIVVTSRSQTATGLPAPAPFRPPRTQLKWLLNTGNFAGHWPPAAFSRPGCRNATDATAGNCSLSCGSTGATSPNTITRLQMIRGGGTAVFVMPTGDGSNRCCIDGVTPQFSLGFVDLKHGVNNLFPVIQPFPDWRAFVDMKPEKPTGSPTNKPTKSPTNNPFETPTDQPTGTPTDQSTGTPTDQSTGTPTDQSTGTPTDQSTGTPTDQSTGTPTDQPTVTPTDNPAGKPMKKLVGKPRNKFSKMILRETTVKPTTQHTRTSTARLARTSTTHTTGTPKTQTTGTPTTQTTGTPTTQTTGTTSTEKPSVKPMNRLTESASEEPTKTTPLESTETASKDTTKITSDDTAKTTPETPPTETATDKPTTKTESDETSSKTTPDEPTKTTQDVRNKTTPNDPCNFMANDSTTTPLPQINVTTEQPKVSQRNQRIINAVDAFLDERGRLLWVLDTGVAGESACVGNMPSSSDSQSTNSDSDMDELLPPKFLAIDVHENEIVHVVSLSRVWRPGLSCFQYIVAIYPDESDAKAQAFGFANYTTPGPDGGTNSTAAGPDDGTTNSTTAGPDGGGGTSDSTTAGPGRCITWPLVVVGDAGTNRLLVYSHDIDKFTEIMLPLEGESSMHMGGGQSGPELFTKPPVRDILYMVPLYPQPGKTRLLITYYGCWDVYNLRLQPSEAEQYVPLSPSSSAAGDGLNTPPPPAAVTGTLTIMGRKPCRMIMLGSDRRRTDIGDQPYFAGGGNTVFFRLENTNDVWSWDTARKSSVAGDGRLIDQRLFRLVRPGRTCRVPVAVSAAPAAAGAKNNGSAPESSSGSGPPQQQQDVRQLMWMLETNFVDHFAGTNDGMGVNAKLQPIETPVHDSRGPDDDDGQKKGRRLLPLRVQPSNERRQNASTASL